MIYTIKIYQIHQLQSYQTTQLGRLSRRGGLLSRALTDLLFDLRCHKQMSGTGEWQPIIPWHRIIIAESNQKVLGWALLRDMSRGRMELMMYVHRKFRRQGIGTQLGKRAKLIHAHYNKELTVYVVDDQGDFYKKLGLIA